MHPFIGSSLYCKILCDGGFGGSGTNDGALRNIANNNISSYASFSVRNEDGKYWMKYALPQAEVIDMVDIASHKDEADRFPKWFKIESSNMA